VICSHANTVEPSAIFVNFFRPLRIYQNVVKEYLTVLKKSLHDPSFFCMKITRAPQGDILGHITPRSNNSFSCMFNSYTQWWTFDKVLSQPVLFQGSKLLHIVFPVVAVFLRLGGIHGGLPQEAAWMLPIIRYSKEEVFRRSLNWLFRKELHICHGRCPGFPCSVDELHSSHRQRSFKPLLSLLTSSKGILGGAPTRLPSFSHK
jgi:hypothetical protein